MQGVGNPDRSVWETPNEADIQCVREQLQRNVKDMLGIVVRCRYGRPQVVANRPLLWDGRAVDALPDEDLDPKRVGIFPTLFWLTCPHLNRAIGRLESTGWVDRLKREIAADPEARQQLEAAHRETAAIRMQLVPESSLKRLQESLPGHYHVLATSGVGGIQPARQRGSDATGDRDTLGVKCLHAHFADYLARGKNPVGRRVWGLLTAAGVDPRGQGACFSGKSCRCPGATPSGQAINHDADEVAATERAPEALIDVGSNSVRLLIGRAELNGQISVVDRELETTRLGLGVSEDGDLAPQAIEATLEVLRAYRERAVASGASEPKAWGTSALREARNREMLLIRAWEEAGIALRVMSGDEEAMLSFRGALIGFREWATDQPVLLADIGGGSTDIVLGDAGGGVIWTQSIPLGAVRLLQQMPHADGPMDWKVYGDAVYTALQEGFANIPKRAEWSALGLADRAAELIVVGGTATSLAAIDLGLGTYDPVRVNGHVLTLSKLGDWLERLAGLGVAERAQIPGLPPQRADIIVPGLVILHTLLEWLVRAEFGQPRCHVSDRDLLEGALEPYVGR